MALGKKTGGRRKGTPNRKNAETMALAAKAGELPHEFLLRVSRGETIDGHKPSFEQRCAAAKDAAPYYAPKLAAVEYTGKDGGPIETADVSDARRVAAAAMLIAKASRANAGNGD